MNGDGNLYVFAVYPGMLFYKHQLTGGGNWSAWSGNLGPMPDGSSLEKVVLATDSTGALNVFAMTNRGNVYYQFPTPPNVFDSTQWHLVGSAPGSTTFQDIAVARNAAGMMGNSNCLEVFMLGNDNSIYSDTQQIAGGAFGATFQQITTTGNTLTQIQAGLDPQGNLEVLALGKDPGNNSNIFVTKQSNWSNLVSINQVPSFVTTYREIALGTNQNGTLYVFALDNHNTVTANEQNTDGTWTQQRSISLGGPGDQVTDIAVAINAGSAPIPNSLEVFTLMTNTNTVDSNTQNPQNSTTWQGFGQIDGGSF